MKRRGESHAGAPLLKGQEPDIRTSGRLAWIKGQIRMLESYIGDHFASLMHSGARKSTASVQMYYITNIVELIMLSAKLSFSRVSMKGNKATVKKKIKIKKKKTAYS